MNTTWNNYKPSHWNLPIGKKGDETENENSSESSVTAAKATSNRLGSHIAFDKNFQLKPYNSLGLSRTTPNAQNKAPSLKYASLETLRKIRMKQDEDYKIAEVLAQKLEEEEMKRAEAERKARELAEAELSEKKMKIKELKKSLIEKRNQIPESPNGFDIAFKMDSKRLIRKFSHESPCDDLYDYIAAEDDLFDENGPITFMLSIPFGEVIAKGKLLKDFGIKSRIQLNINYD